MISQPHISHVSKFDDRKPHDGHATRGFPVDAMGFSERQMAHLSLPAGFSEYKHTTHCHVVGAL